MMMAVRGAIVAAACVATALVSILLAQAHPDFSGTWVVEKVEMQSGQGGDVRGGPGGFGGGGRGGGRRGGGFGGGMPRPGGGGRDGGQRGQGVRPPPGLMLRDGDTITIKQTMDRLIITHKAEGADVMSSYALDGSESKNVGPGGGTVSSKTKWEGVALVTDSSVPMQTPRGDMTMKMREVRTESDDRQKMTVVQTNDTPAGKRITTVRFGRSAK